jgi:hypothetical protein
VLGGYGALLLGCTYSVHVIEEKIMSREAGDRYRCEGCGAELVYEKPCPCGDKMAHSEVCCGEQMVKVDKKE